MHNNTFMWYLVRAIIEHEHGMLDKKTPIDDH